MERKLERNQHDKMIGGVASGLADYLLVDSTIIRVAFILLAVFGGSGLLIYLILWIVIPERSLYESFQSLNTDYKSASPQPLSQPLVMPEVKKSNSGRFIAGFILIAIGTYFLLDEFDIIPHWFSIWKLWPVILIVTGILMLLKSGKKKLPPPAEKPVVTDWDTEKTSQADTNTSTDQPLA